MLNKRTRWTSLLVVLGGFTLMTFQNCAPADTGTSEDGEVRIVDRWANSKVKFLAESYLVDPSVGSVNIRGFCDGSEEFIQWEAVRAELDGEMVLGEGEVDCVDGRFDVEVAVSDQELWNCDSSLEVRATAANEETLTQLRRACL